MTQVVRLVVIPTIVAGVATLLWPGRVDRGSSSRRVPTAPVVVAAEEIREGERIERTSVTVARWPLPTIPAGAYWSVDSVIGRVARINVFEGEAIVPGRLAPTGTRAGIGVRLTPGKRAFSIRINDFAGVAGMIRPNSRVDVLVTVNYATDPKQRMAKIFMSNMRVLAIGPYGGRGADRHPMNSYVVTLELTADEAELIAKAASHGELSIALRGNGDPDSIVTSGATAAEVITSLRSATGKGFRSDTARGGTLRGTTRSP